MGTRHFKTKAKYRKWIIYGQMHGTFTKTQGHQKIYIKGWKHKVKHKRK